MTDAPALLPEEWREIAGHPGYEISSLGNVRSWWVKGVPARRSEAPTMLRPRIDRGYYKLVLRSGRKTKTLFVHRLVLLAFRGEPPDGHESRHLNGNAADNRLCNLAWSTHTENCADQRAHGTHRTGSRMMRAKLSDPVVIEIRAMHAAGWSLARLGRKFGVRWQTIQGVVRRKTWTHI